MMISWTLQKHVQAKIHSNYLTESSKGASFPHKKGDKKKKAYHEANQIPHVL